MEGSERYRRAKRHIARIKGFYIHFFLYVIVNVLLFFVNLFSGGAWWFYWPLLGWGIGVAAHALTVFGIVGFLGPTWEEKKTREFMEKMDRDSWHY